MTRALLLRHRLLEIPIRLCVVCQPREVSGAGPCMVLNHGRAVEPGPGEERDTLCQRVRRHVVVCAAQGRPVGKAKGKRRCKHSVSLTGVRPTLRTCTRIAAGSPFSRQLSQPSRRCRTRSLVSIPYRQPPSLLLSRSSGNARHAAAGF